MHICNCLYCLHFYDQFIFHYQIRSISAFQSYFFKCNRYNPFFLHLQTTFDQAVM